MDVITLRCVICVDPHAISTYQIKRSAAMPSGGLDTGNWRPLATINPIDSQYIVFDHAVATVAIGISTYICIFMKAK